MGGEVGGEVRADVFAVVANSTGGENQFADKVGGENFAHLFAACFVVSAEVGKGGVVFFVFFWFLAGEHFDQGCAEGYKFISGNEGLGRDGLQGACEGGGVVSFGHWCEE